MTECGIYIHVPWCRRRCPYCDFYFEVGKAADEFSLRVKKEFETKNQNSNRHFQSLYFGGGTPSLLPAKQIQFLVQFLKKNGLKDDAEITLECNPEDLNPEYVNAILNAGINRVSLGVQSFDNKVLKILGRMHSETNAKDAIKILQKFGLKNISVDLIIGVWKENISSILDHIQWLEKNAVPHISCYLLTIEENTNFYRRIKNNRLPQICDESQADAYRRVQKKLIELGYIQYDVSSFAKEDFYSMHNQIYWGKGEYIGLGPGAHSMELLPGGKIRRFSNVQNTSAWFDDAQKFPLKDSEILSPHEALLESLAFGLRNMKHGINISALESRHNSKAPAEIKHVLEKMQEYQWVEQNDHHLRISLEGALFADRVMREILCCV